MKDQKAKVYAYWNMLDGSFHVLSTKGANFSSARRRFDIIERGVTCIDGINTKGFPK